LPKSWHFDAKLKENVVLEENESYQLVDASHEDKQKLVSFYQISPVPGYEVASVRVIYNPGFDRQFSLHISKLQERHGNPVFILGWRNENDLAWREATHQKLETWAAPYQDPDAPNVKILPVWHGTNRAALDSIFRAGFVSLASTDTGYFGKGLYGAKEASYSHRVYSKGGALLLNWVSFYSAYPVIDGDKNKLMGKGNYQNYDAHFIPVVPANPANPNQVNYYPCKVNQLNVYTEVVVFESAGCLPRYLVELQPILIKAPKAIITPPPAVQQRAHDSTSQTPATSPPLIAAPTPITSQRGQNIPPPPPPPKHSCIIL
jgi:hypothetical protein